VKNVSALKKIKIAAMFRVASAQFSWPKEGAQVPACLAKQFEPGEKCEVTARYGVKEVNAFASLEVEDETKQRRKRLCSANSLVL
jgi:hypothetical protein